MTKRIEKDGKFYRLRRGRLVEIPKEWVGRVTTPKTIRGRSSKALHKHRKLYLHGGPSIDHRIEAVNERELLQET